MSGLLTTADARFTGHENPRTKKETSGMRNGRSDRHLTTVVGLERGVVESWMARADDLRAAPRLDVRTLHPDRIVGALFYEPSTRTRLSFEAAALRLGARVIGAENAMDNSSAKKGERLEDTLRIVGAYTDAIVVRHHEDKTLGEAAPLSPVPIISAGTGAGEHPSQALLDVYTLHREFGRVDGLTIAILGDLRYGRTVHSLVKLLTLFENVRVILVPISGLELPQAVVDATRGSTLQLETAENLRDVLPLVDAVYQTRVQRERLPAASRDLAGSLNLGVAELAHMQGHARILHPLPRVDEIHPDVDIDVRAAYFRQAENGLYIRMAILDDFLQEGHGTGWEE